MKINLILLCLFCILLGCSSTQLAVSSNNEQANSNRIAELAQQSTVALVFKSPKTDETVPYCTGVWLSEKLLLTALHCARAGATVEEINKLPKGFRGIGGLFVDEVKDPTGSNIDYIMANEVVGFMSEPRSKHQSKVVLIDNSHDLALLAITSPAPEHKWLHIADAQMPKVGDKVFIMGHPGGLYFTFFDGTVSALRTDWATQEEGEDLAGLEPPFIQMFSGIYPGNSGGPVISENGELIGIVSFVMHVPNQGFAIPAVSMRNLVLKAYYNNLI